MPDREIDALAGFIGSRWPLLLALLALILVAVVVVLALVGAWVVRNREWIWRGVSRVWSRVARRAAGTTPDGHHPLHPHVAQLLSRLTPYRFLALHFVLGLALSLAVVGFVNIAEEVGRTAGMVRFDLALSGAVHDSVDPDVVRVFDLLTWFGSGQGLTLAGVLVLGTLLARRERILAVGWAVALVGVGLLNGLLKGFYRRDRPTFDDPFITAGGWSFPSGHSMSTFVAAGMLAYLGIVFLRRPASRLAAVAAAVVWTVLMGFSRILLGAHYFSDVIGGYAAGTVWLAVCISGLELVRRRSRLNRPVPETAARSHA
jgi:undecaprenyl-diphosphatase